MKRLFACCIVLALATFSTSRAHALEGLFGGLLEKIGEIVDGGFDFPGHGDGGDEGEDGEDGDGFHGKLDDFFDRFGDSDLLEKIQDFMDSFKEKILSKFDLDGDGEVTREEIAEIRETLLRDIFHKHLPPACAELIAQYDADEDGRLGEEERALLKADIIAEFDENEDGELDEDERAAARANSPCSRNGGDADDSGDGGDTGDEGEDTGNEGDADVVAALVRTLEPTFLRGDANVDSEINISDPVRILLALFITNEPLECADAADSNDDGRVDVSDAASILATLFQGASGLIHSPYPAPGFDPTPDEISCAVELGLSN